MSDNSDALQTKLERIKTLSDSDLLRIVSAVEEQFAPDVVEAATAEIAYRRLSSTSAGLATPRVEAQFRVFRSLGSWDALCRSAADFATKVGPDRVIGISHSSDAIGEGVVIVWYWSATLPQQFQVG